MSLFALSASIWTAPYAVAKDEGHGHAKNKSAANEKLELGELMIYNGNRKAGILALEQAVQLNPDLLQAHTDLANVFGDAGRTEEQLRELREVVRLKPGDIDTRVFLASVLRREGKFDEALSNLEECLKTIKDPYPIKLNMAFTMLDGGKIEEANSLLESFPGASTDSSIVLGRAMCQFKLGKLESAKGLIDKAESIKRPNPEAHCLRGDLLFSQGLKAEAIVQYEIAAVEKPDLAQAHESLANALLDLGDYTRSGNEYREANKWKPHDSEILYGIAIAAEKSGDIAEAIKNYEEALQYERDAERRSTVHIHLTKLRAI